MKSTSASQNRPLAVRKTSSQQVIVWQVTFLFLAVAAVYWPILQCGFIWDDNAMLTENVFVKASNGLRFLWFSTEPADYFPLTYTSFWLEWRLWGMNAAGYHVTNLLLHAASTILLWRILMILKVPGAWLAALIFGIHPVTVESVAWIAERKNTLCLFFYLLSVLFFLRSKTQGGTGPRTKIGTENIQYGLSLAFFLLALLSKTSVVMLPVVLLLCLWWQNKKPMVRDFLRTIPFFILSLVLGLVTLWFQQQRSIGQDVIREANFWTRFGDAGLAIWFYLYKAIFPLHLSFVYPQWEIVGKTLLSILAWIGLLFFFAVFWWKRQTWGRPLLFATGYFALMLLPILGLVNIYFHRYALVADHWQYFALPGLVALVVGMIAHVFKSRSKPERVLIWITALCAVGLLGFAASRQVMVYKNSKMLWEDTLSKNPKSWLALNNLGLLLHDEGKTAEAILHFEKSLRLKPEQIEGYNNLGAALLNLGKFDEAMTLYQQALKINSKFPMTHCNIANVLDHQGKIDEAMAEYRETLRLDPHYVDAHNNLGCMLVLQGKMEEGMAHFREALRTKPDNADTLNNLGSTLIESGRPREAIPLLSRAIEIKPGYADAFYNLGNALLAINQVPDALKFYSAALKINPQMPLVFYKMGNAFFQMGKMDEALSHFLRAVEMNPNMREAHYQIAVILSAAKNFEPAIPHFKEAIRLKPDWMEPLNNLAWILATNPEEKFRDGKLAVEFAERACALTENKNPGALDTLAAAYAQNGEFSKAVSAATKAQDLMTSLGNKTAVEQISARLKLYRAGKPFHE